MHANRIINKQQTNTIITTRKMLVGERAKTTHTMLLTVDSASLSSAWLAYLEKN